MHWQDIVFAVGDLFFCVALIPSIVSEEKPSPLTSFISALVLIIFTAVYITLSLPLSAITSIVNAVMWLALGAQGVIEYKDWR